MVPRDLPIPGRDLAGVHFAMEYLVQQNKVGAGDTVADQITAEGKHVVVLGGGDTGADCIGTAHRQGAARVTNLAIGTQPPTERPDAPAVADDADALRGLERARGGRRARVTSPRPSSSSRNEVGEVRAHPRRRDRVPRRPPRAEGGHRARDPRRPRAPRARLHRSRERTTSTTSSSVPFDDRGNVARDERLPDQPSPASSSPATRAAASRSSSGRSPRAAQRPPPSTGTLKGRRSCRSRSDPPTGPSSV